MTAARAGGREHRILDAAAALISRYGYGKTTVSDIANAAGVSKGAIYLHWESKDRLFEALLAREMERLMADVMARVEADPDGGTLPAVYRHALLALLANPFMKALYTRDSRILGDLVRRQGAAWQRRGFLFAEEYVRRLQEARLLRDDHSPALTCFVLAILSYGLLTLQAIVPPEDAPPIEETLAALADLVQHGLVPQCPGDGEAGKRALRQYLGQAASLQLTSAEPRPDPDS